MSDLVQVTVAEQPVTVTLSDDSQQLTITDNTTQQVQVIDASGQINITAQGNTPTVTVNTGGGGMTDRSALLATLTGYITSAQMSSTLQSDLTELRSLWARVGTALDLLTVGDGETIKEVSRSYTDDIIMDAVAEITATTDEITANVSSVTQTASEIQQSVTEYQTDAANNFTAHDARITQNSTDITTAVSEISSIGDTTTALQSAVTVNATAITQEVSARTALADEVTSAQSLISQLSDSITLAVDSVSSLADRMTSAELVLGDDGVNITVLESALNDAAYSIETLQTILSNQWGVSITEEVGGSTYATGFKSVLHPTWLSETEYTVNDTVYYDSTVYTCILAHTASVDNNPSSTNAATYWSSSDGSQSEFTVQADAFYIKTPSGVEPVFSVTESGTELNSDLLINGVVQIVADSSDVITGITGNQIASNTITGSNIAATTITGAKIATGTITADKIVSNSITATQIAANAITASELAADSVTSAKIATGAVTADAVSTNTIIASSANIASAVVTTAKIANLSVSTLKIADNAVTQPVSNAITSSMTLSNTHYWYNLIGITATLSGGGVLIFANAGMYTDHTEKSAPLKTAIYRYNTTTEVETLLVESEVMFVPPGTTWVGVNMRIRPSMQIMDFPAAGTYTYRFKAWLYAEPPNVIVSNRQIFILETKK